MAEYTFGDSALAAERLGHLDSVFGPSTDELLLLCTDRPGRVADLGCGPGWTTTRLGARYPTASLTGIDASEAFVDLARTSVPVATFVVGDVTQPLPGAPFDLIYARFVLAHLHDAPAAVANWTAALAPGGSLVLEETEHISTDDPDFSEYEALVRRRVGITGAQVYAGSLIRADLPSRLEVVVDRVLAVDLTAADAAAMFRRNLEAWGSDAIDQGLVTKSGCADLLERLRARESDNTRGCFDWTHRQLVARTTH